MSKKSYFRLSVSFPGDGLMYVYYDEDSCTYGFSRTPDYADLFELNELLDIISSNLISNVRAGINDINYYIHYVYSIT